MQNFSQDLFLLFTTLSQMNSRDRLTQLFMESINNIFESYSFIWHFEKPEDAAPCLEVCTRKKTYGFLSYADNGSPDAIIGLLIHNSVQILAALLEKIEQENNMQDLIDLRTKELRQANEELEQTNRDLEEQIEAKKRTLGTLRKSEEKYKSLIDKVQTAIILHDGNGLIIDSNPLAKDLLGFSNEEFIGSSPADDKWDFLREDGSVMPVSEYPVSRVLSTKESVRDYVVGIRHRTGDLLTWVLVNAEPEFGEEGEILQVIVSFIDMTERKKMEELFRQSQKMDAIGQLAGGVAHDFNNMLSGIVSSAQILRNPKRNLDEKGLKFVELILDASKQAADLTSKLLTFGRKTTVSSVQIGIHKIIDETVSLLERTIDKRIKITLSNKAERSAVIGDRTALLNSLLNLGINASHAMPEGGELHVGTRNIFLNENYCFYSPFDISPGEFIEIEIRDTGCGIAPDKIDRIFEPFYTTKDPGHGTGLGLSTVYATIQNHKGAINIYSEQGVGTVFHLYLPCAGEVQKQQNSEEITFSGKGLILFVDDEEIIRITGKETLEEMGFTVLLAKNGTEAVKVYKENHSEIKLVLMDMLMPELNGTDAFYQIRQIDRSSKVIIMSGFTKNENLQELKSAGLAGFIQKPFRDFELSKLLTEVLGLGG